MADPIEDLINKNIWLFNVFTLQDMVHVCKLTRDQVKPYLDNLVEQEIITIRQDTGVTLYELTQDTEKYNLFIKKLVHR